MDEDKEKKGKEGLEVRSVSWQDTVCFTWVWVSPSEAASSALSGSARYWVLWNLLLSCWSCKLEYIVRGFLIFFPFPLTRTPNVSSNWDLSGQRENKMKNKTWLWWVNTSFNVTIHISIDINMLGAWQGMVPLSEQKIPLTCIQSIKMMLPFQVC